MADTSLWAQEDQFVSLFYKNETRQTTNNNDENCLTILNCDLITVVIHYYKNTFFLDNNGYTATFKKWNKKKHRNYMCILNVRKRKWLLFFYYWNMNQFVVNWLACYWYYVISGSIRHHSGRIRLLHVFLYY